MQLSPNILQEIHSIITPLIPDVGPLLCFFRQKFTITSKISELLQSENLERDGETISLFLLFNYQLNYQLLIIVNYCVVVLLYFTQAVLTLSQQ